MLARGHAEKLDQAGRPWDCPPPKGVRPAWLSSGR
jgi:hypothetical protein